jgi:protein-tyrosine phosphatase
MLLTLAGVGPEEIAADYALSEDRVPFGRVGTFYEENGTTAAEVITAMLAELDVETHLRAAGVSAGDVAAIRARLRR